MTLKGDERVGDEMNNGIDVCVFSPLFFYSRLLSLPPLLTPLLLSSLLTLIFFLHYFSSPLLCIAPRLSNEDLWKMLDP